MEGIRQKEEADADSALSIAQERSKGCASESESWRAITADRKCACVDAAGYYGQGRCYLYAHAAIKEGILWRQ